jgi:hypothetical protein
MVIGGFWPKAQAYVDNLMSIIEAGFDDYFRESDARAAKRGKDH